MLPVDLLWASCANRLTSEGSMDIGSTVHHSVIAFWKHTSKIKEAVMISVCKDEIKYIIIPGGSRYVPYPTVMM